MDKVTEFNAYRVKMNEKLMGSDNKLLKRFFNLDTNAYQEGALPSKTIANLVGGSICIPYTRRALEYWEALKQA